MHSIGNSAEYINELSVKKSAHIFLFGPFYNNDVLLITADFLFVRFTCHTN